MIGKIGILFVALVTVFLITRLFARQKQRVERTLSRAARKTRQGAPKTLEKDPETGKYRARDEHRNKG